MDIGIRSGLSVCFALSLGGLWCQCSIGQERVQTSLADSVPHLVQSLFKWPEEQLLSGKARVESNSRDVLGANEDYQRWIKAVIDTTMLPGKSENLIFIRDEFGKVDTARMEWKISDYDVKVSQTSAIFTLKISPIDSRSMGVDFAERVDVVRELARRFFPDSGSIYRFGSETGAYRVPLVGLREAILATSFNSASVSFFTGDNSVFGKPIKKENALPENGIESTRDSLAFSKGTWDCWFRNVYWWNDGKSVGFYFLKIEGIVANPWSFSDQFGTEWF